MAMHLNDSVPIKCKDPYSYMNEKVKDSIFFKPTKEDEVLEIIRHLKNSSSGHDLIDVKIIKAMQYEIVKPLVHIFNLSFTQGKIPDSLKIAKVIPIYKKGDRSLFSNYRPISVLPVFSKILEKLAYSRISSFLDKNQILTKHQFGFRKNRSTDLAIQTMVDTLHDVIENNDLMVGLFIDLSRAFDTISHDILLGKLDYYGIRGTPLNWLADYLKNRKQYVSYNNYNSSMANITIGVPQGSILGPLLFLLYVNDIVLVSDKLSYILYADDTNIFMSGKSLTYISNVLNNELKMLNEWFLCNKLSLIVAKTHYMIMSSQGKRYNPDDCHIYFGGHILDRVSSTKFLGVIIDDKFTWKLHIDYIYNKLSKAIGIIRRASQLLYGESLQMLYNSLIKPHFTYCITIWGNSFKTYIHKLYILQKRVVRIISRSEFHSHTAPLFQTYNIMTVYELYIYFVGLFIYKSLNNNIPYCNVFHRNINQRNSQNLRSVFRKKENMSIFNHIFRPKDLE